MRSSTIKTCRRLALFGVIVGPAFWLAKTVLSLLGVLRDAGPGQPATLVDRIRDTLWWDAAAVSLIGLSICSGIVLYVIVCPPPKDIDQHEA